MQTVQFKVLNIDTQETNVQMQTENTEAENKAQNSQNTEQTSDAHTDTPFQAVKIETEKIGLSVPAKSIIYHESALVTKNILKNCTKITTK